MAGGENFHRRIFKKGESLGRLHFQQTTRRCGLSTERPGSGVSGHPQFEFFQAWEIYCSDVALELETA
jgi:hypothetical protein